MKKLLFGFFSLALLLSFFMFDDDSYSLNVYFCPQDDCEGVFLEFLDSASESIECALFDVGLESVKEKLIEKSKVMDVRVVTDDQYYDKFNENFVRKDRSGLMHNKFCIIDGKKVSTGSMNPTENGVNKNNNNLIFIEHSGVVKNFEDEFDELWGSIFKKGSKVKKQYSIKTYFCPEDNCAYILKEELKKAKESIYFMTFSFTHDEIANVLLLKNLDGLDVKGVMEAKQVTIYSQFERLVENNVDVVKDRNKNNMHHKVFIVDDCVITGSFNPTNGGNRRNDENLVVICNEEVVEMFEGEFYRVYP